MKGRCRESLHENGLDSARTRFCYFFERHNGTKDPQTVAIHRKNLTELKTLTELKLCYMWRGP